MTERRQRWFHLLYDSRIRMTSEEYLYILYLLLGANLAFGLGLIIGLVWSLVL